MPTTQKFDKLLSFDAKMAGDTFETTAMNSNEAGPKLLPMFKLRSCIPIRRSWCATRYIMPSVPRISNRR